MDDEIKRLEWLLARIQLLDPPFRGSEEGKDLYQEICKLVFEDQLYVRLWSEPTLNQLEHLFQTEKPDEELFESELQEISTRTRTVKEVNDFFFAIVDPNTTSKRLCKLLAKLKVFRRNLTSIRIVRSTTRGPNSRYVYFSKGRVVPRIPSRRPHYRFDR